MHMLDEAGMSHLFWKWHKSLYSDEKYKYIRNSKYKQIFSKVSINFSKCVETQTVDLKTKVTNAAFEINEIQFE